MGLRNNLWQLVLLLSICIWFSQLQLISCNCGSGPGIATRLRACPYDPPGLEVTKGLAGSCPVGEEVYGDCVSDEDCFLKKLGNVCCYSRCRGVTECYRFPK